MTASADRQQRERDLAPQRAVTLSRAVALVLVGLLVLGLGYLRFGSGEGAVSVPSGAQAGDLTLEACEYATEDGSYAADCGTLVVPENRADPGSRLIALPVTRIRAVSADPQEPIFRLEGGPGITNMRFAAASRFAEEHDVVLVGYRGVDGSVRLDCPEVDSALRHSTDLLGKKSFRAYADGFRACASRLTEDGVDVVRYGLTEQVEDLEAAREALGYDRIDLLSESAGTRTALIYAWRHPERIHRSVLIGANPPGHFLWDGKTTDEQIARYGALCEHDESCRTRADGLLASMRRTAADMPDDWLSLPIQESNVRVFSFYGLMESTSETPLNAPQVLDAWLSAADGDASGLWLQSVAADLFPIPFVWGQYAAAGSADAQAVREYFSHGRERRLDLGRDATAFAWGGGLMADAWPAAIGEAAYSRMRRSDVETLVVSGELDVSTPPQVATRELLPYLPNGSQVVLPGLGHTLSFWNEQPDAGTRLITTYLESGRVDDSGYEPQRVDLTPAVPLTTIAKIAAGTMVGVALLAALSLLAMARRVYGRGRLGRRSSVLLRSVYPVVLGVGGWFAGVLIVLTTMPSVPLDDELLAALSVGAPVGLGIHLAWTNRDRPGGARATGFAAALAGALVGAWLGFGVSEGLAALLTTIAGATAGANLLLLALDIAWARQARDQVVVAAPGARPVTG